MILAKASTDQPDGRDSQRREAQLAGPMAERRDARFLRLALLQQVVAIASDSHHNVHYELHGIWTMAANSEPLRTSAQPSASLPHPGTERYAELPQFPKGSALPFRRTIRRRELHQIVPLAETTIYEMEQHGEFPRRFRLTPRCVVWDLEEVEAWIEGRKQASRSAEADTSPGPDVRLRRHRPVR